MSGQNQKTDKRIAWSIIIMNFTGVYDYEAFARNNKFIWLDCRHLYGTEGYCDRDGTLALKRMIADYPAEGVHFIDSGNYHYLTKFWTDKLETPFSLIVFDHHPDMQPPLFDNILSCGSWVKDILDHNNNCKKVIIVGSSDKLIQAVPKGYERQVRFYSETYAHARRGLAELFFRTYQRTGLHFHRQGCLESGFGSNKLGSRFSQLMGIGETAGCYSSERTGSRH